MMNSLITMPVMEIQEAKSRYNALINFTREMMKAGIDYGVVPGTAKNTLLKPGAEKLTTFFGLSPVFEPVNSKESWDAVEPLFFYQYRCKLYRGDVFMGEGIGSCNSRESKYRWRWVGEEDIAPHLDPAMLVKRKSSIVEFEFAINKRETTGKYGKPAEYWDAFETAIQAGDARKVSRKTSSGKDFPAWEIETVVYRVPNEDIFSLVNTIDKMAQKRAFIAATLVAVNASEYFTQDLEDLEEFAVVIEGTAVEVKEETPAPSTTPLLKFKTIDGLLYQISVDFGLSEIEAKQVLRELGYTKFAESKAGQMYEAVKVKMSQGNELPEAA